MSDKKLECISLNIHTTTACTLKCAKCGWSFPHFNPPINANSEKTISSFDKLFQVYDHIHEIRFGGAEAFLYANIVDMMQAIGKYKDHFDYAIVITNGTYIPKKTIIDVMKKLPYPIIVRVDNYGSLSGKYDELIKYLLENNIQIDERLYNGDIQAFGGWVYYGDYTDKHYSQEQLQEVFQTCRLPDDCAILTDSMLTNCCYATAGSMLGKVSMKEREVVDLSSNITIEEMRQSIRAWRNEPFEACKYCNGFDPVNSPRIPAAEQISD